MSNELNESTPEVPAPDIRQPQEQVLAAFRGEIERRIAAGTAAGECRLGHPEDRLQVTVDFLLERVAEAHTGLIVMALTQRARDAAPPPPPQEQPLILVPKATGLLSPPRG